MGRIEVQDESISQTRTGSGPFSYFKDKFWLVYGKEGLKLYPLLTMNFINVFWYVPQSFLTTFQLHTRSSAEGDNGPRHFKERIDFLFESFRDFTREHHFHDRLHENERQSIKSVHLLLNAWVLYGHVCVYHDCICV